MDWDDLVGTWSFHMGHPEGTGWLRLLQDGRAFQSVWTGWPRPDTRVPMMAQMVMESPRRCRVRLAKGTSDGWTMEVFLHCDKMLLAHGGKEFLCTRAEDDEIPAWFLADFDRAIASWPP